MSTQSGYVSGARHEQFGHPPSDPRSARLPLPRLEESARKSQAPTRNLHACDRCRQLKRKCTGGQQCRTCEAEGLQCVSSQGKRERDKRDLEQIVQQNLLLERDQNTLLEALSQLRQNPGLRIWELSRVSELLAGYQIQQVEDDQFGAPVSMMTKKDSQPDLSEERKGERNAAAIRVGSPSRQGVLSAVVDLGKGAGAQGFIGKASEISWLERCQQHVLSFSGEDTERLGGQQDRYTLTVQQVNFYTDDIDLLAIDEDIIDETAMPADLVATGLCHVFFETFYATFPLLDKDQLLHNLATFHDLVPENVWLQRVWLAMANMVFCLGSNCLYLKGSTDQVSADDHLLYYARARKLGLDHRIVLDHPTIEQVQALGMLGLYMVVKNQISRAWTVIGQAIRHAIALGMHLKMDIVSISTREKTTRARTWYALYSLEILVAEITGRPTTMIRLSEISVPVEAVNMDLLVNARRDHPQDYETKTSRPSAVRSLSISQSTTSSLSDIETITSHLFPQQIRVSMISHEICVSLYSAGLDCTWSEFQNRVSLFESKIRELAVEDIPPSYLKGWPGYSRCQVEFQMAIQSLRMLLYRPCLCNWERRIRDESAASQIFNRRAAQAGIGAARKVLTLLPESPSAHLVYHALPWWRLLHFICQAAAFLLLELSLQACHVPQQVPEMMKDVRKAILYLEVLSSYSPSASKAHAVISHSLQKVTSALTSVPRWSDGIEDP